MTLGEETLLDLTVSLTDRNREYWMTREWVGSSTRETAQNADVWILPWVDLRKGQPALFPEGTTGFVRELSAAVSGARISVVIDQDKYKEISLHADEWRWPAIFVTLVLLPTLTQVLGDQISKRISGEPSVQDTRVEMEVIIEGQRGRCASIKYKGPANELAKTLVEQAARCFPADGKTTEERVTNVKSK